MRAPVALFFWVGGGHRYHTAWTGPIDRYQTEFEALLDSWLMTQDTARAEFHFWYMDREADPTNPFEKHYSEISRGLSGVVFISELFCDGDGVAMVLRRC